MESDPWGQPIGCPLPHWKAPPSPAPVTLKGRNCRIDPLDPAKDREHLYRNLCIGDDGRSWTYLGYGPFGTEEAFATWLASVAGQPDPLFFVIRGLGVDEARGVASYLRITPGQGSIEIGHLHFGAQLRGTAAGAEAIYLLADHAFALGYRRLEWKCDSLNSRSRAAALRYGFTPEGVFRQAMIYKGRNRDTAWYSILDRDWPRIREGWQAWLAPENFATDGAPRSSLKDQIAHHLGPAK